MCIPAAALLGAALSVGGSLIAAQQQQAFANKQAQAQREAYEIARKARIAEQQRQDEWSRQSYDDFDSTVDALSVDKSVESTQNEADQFMEDFDNMNQTVDEGQYLSGQEGTASDAVKTYIAGASANAAKEARERATALANLTGYDRTGLNRGVILGDNSDNLTIMNNIRRGSLAVSSDEQSIAAPQVTQGGGGIGTILGGLGSALGGSLSNAGGYKAGVNG